MLCFREGRLVAFAEINHQVQKIMKSEGNTLLVLFQGRLKIISMKGAKTLVKRQGKATIT